MTDKIKMHDFVTNGCVAIKEAERFIENWFATNRNPCSTCNIVKSKCSYYLKLVELEAIVD